MHFSLEHTTLLLNHIQQLHTSSITGSVVVVRLHNLPILHYAYGTRHVQILSNHIYQALLTLPALEEYKVYSLEQNLYAIVTTKILQEPFLFTFVDRLHTTIQECCDSLYPPLYVVPLLGITRLVDITYSPEEILQRALLALYFVEQHTARRYALYEDTIPFYTEAIHDMKLARAYYEADRHEKLSLAFQPVAHTATGDILYHECLLRMRTETLISAGHHISVAEKYGFIQQIDEKVLSMVILALQEYPSVRLGLNLSHATISDPRWHYHISHYLKEKSLAERLVIEITETALPTEQTMLSRFIDYLRSFGCKIALDDFGTGNTSFKQIASLTFDYIKIDGYYIQDIAHNPNHQRFVNTLAEFIHNEKLLAIAECVEDEATFSLLQGIHIDYVQGNLLGEPIPTLLNFDAPDNIAMPTISPSKSQKKPLQFPSSDGCGDS